ncbi:hypothetical protein F5Y14DRAFT_209172 [Nemania sp. NC0429]|nr:hypothetical protein F5Y14DRAFT_209172 [Nemania sp. NC0429]
MTSRLPDSRDGTTAHQHSKPTVRKKVKTGCRTCKVRHVKCDEGRPACHRCVSTGRACDGYGIWGGGEMKQAGRALTPRTHVGPVRSAISSQYGKLSSEQQTCFRWFSCWTYTKLPLPFITPFWDTLVLQACTAEPAILHAVLALGSAHQKESLDEADLRDGRVALDPQQKFMLGEYGKAMRHLRPHFSTQDRRSVHVALVVCTLFTFFENLLGRYATANAHLHAGLRLLAETYANGDHVASRTITTKSRGSVDNWIIESFSRLHVQAALLGQGLLSIYPRLPIFPITPIPTVFVSTNEAAHYMDRLMLDILYQAEQCSSSNCNGINPTLSAALHESRRRLRGELRSWLAAYDATDPDASEAFSSVDRFYILLLRGYHTMSTIIINSCDLPASETIYDRHTAEFLSLLEQLIAIWKAHLARPAWRPKPGPAEMPRNISHSVGDKGWIPLLYFIAVKCRVHRLRLQAIRLLSRSAHKEGIWNSKLALAIAKEVTRIEEGDFYRDLDTDDQFATGSVPTEQDITLPPLPDDRRMYNLRIGLPEHPMGVLTLEYELKRRDQSGRDKKKRYYDLQARRWGDVVSDEPVYYEDGLM